MNIDPAWIITGLMSVVASVSVFILKENNNTLARLDARVTALETRQAVQDQWNKNIDEKLDRIITKLDT